MQHFLESEVTKDHIRWVKVNGIASYWKAWFITSFYVRNYR